MSLKLIILIASFIAFAVLNSKFLGDDVEFRNFSKENAGFKDPLGLKKFRAFPKKMALLMGVLLGPIFLYYFFLGTG
ncbi:MAG: hypothetical protein JKY31_14110 [Rhodobacteraceae bacterium]|nr:hypothetical protein [Paracoccaceae bacterium]